MALQELNWACPYTGKFCVACGGTSKFFVAKVERFQNTCTCDDNAFEDTTCLVVIV
jgi:hypothetical protein